MSGKRSFPADRRAVSVTITHVLTIAITTILISGLLIGTGTLLDNQKDRATYDEKSTIGDRLATEITAVDQAAQRADGPSTVTVQTEHPRRLSGGQYFVTLYDDDAGECNTWGPDQCLVIESGQTDNVEVPLTVETDIDTSTTVQGGDIWIHYDGSKITISQERP
jgi:FlaG/FlaF family flagellin (archaellin)